MPLPQQRWRIAPPQPTLSQELASQTGLTPLTAQLLLNRRLTTPQVVQDFLRPNLEVLPDPLVAFRQVSATVAQQFSPEVVAWIAGSLDYSIERLSRAIQHQEKIAICGDYDVDGMTSTALLLRTFRVLGGIAHYEIPHRMTEGYGINDRMVQELYHQGIQIIITVDNGIAAHGAISLARSLGLTVIVTDHHDIPDTLPPAAAILNPQFLAPTSPFATIAGVGVAYVLALELATVLGQRALLEDTLLVLFTLGTIADLAQLSGINRTLVKKGLQVIPQTQIVGVQALIHHAGINLAETMKPEAIGFRLGPRINAVGRIGDPPTVIELLTTEDWLVAQEKAQTCESLNVQRQQLCLEIEQQAVTYIEAQIQSGMWNLSHDRVVVVVDREVSPETSWHHGVIGIVASRLVERFGAAVFIGSVEESGKEVRFSVRGIPEFPVFDALQDIADIRGKGGGHRAAGGFSMDQAHLPQLRPRLTAFADRVGVLAAHIQPLLQLDAEIDLRELSLDLMQELELLQPCGLGNPDPLFYSRGVRVVSQKIFGKESLHLSAVLDRGDGKKIQATAWRWSAFYPLPEYIDIAYSLKTKTFQAETAIELELKGARTFSLEVAAPPALPIVSTWHPLAALPPTLPALLIYGHQRPTGVYELHTPDLAYDRPTKPYAAMVLWSLPPSLVHLQWLLAITKPQQVYRGTHTPPTPSIEELTGRLHQLEKSGKINLLALSQEWWISPAAIVAGLRDLGYRCPSYPATLPLQQELENLHAWYHTPLEHLATLFRL